MSILNPKTYKYSDPDLAKRLWPTYLETGNIEKVLVRVRDLVEAGELAQGISKPTLLKMKDHFGWEAERERAGKSAFRGGLDQTGDLEAMMAELIAIKNELGAKVAASIDKDLHQIYGQYIGQILKIQDMLKKEKTTDKAALLVTAFKVVVKFLTDGGHETAAQDLADSLEFLAKRVEAEWAA